MSRFFRGRWEYGSVYVLDIDRVICDPEGRHGILIEEKHESSAEKSARITRELARRCGWWAGLFVYSTHDGTPGGEVTSIDAKFWDPRGGFHHVESMRFDSFDQWVCDTFGARAAA